MVVELCHRTDRIGERIKVIGPFATSRDREKSATPYPPKPVMAKKRRWIELDGYREDVIDGARLSADTQEALNQLDSEGFEVTNMTPVTSGHFSWTNYSKGGRDSIAPETCASWGYSVTEGVMIAAKRR